MFNPRLVILIILIIFSSKSYSQVGESPIRFFGYFQIPFYHQDVINGPGHNSFNLQQLNLFAQKDLGRDWTTLINLEFLNTYSSNKFWGAFNLEEAWVRYRSSKELNIKIGLQIPIFNNLNEINNRTPLLPYIIRPLAYETSFGDFLDIESFIPKRTFIQAYGYFPSGDFKFDYAFYVGNSPNIATLKVPSDVQSGIDTTNTFLLGGRTGVRYENLKAGLSITYDVVNDFGYIDTILGLSPSSLNEIKRYRLGGDFSYSYSDLSLEVEFVKVILDDNFSEIDFDKMFYYGTLSYQFSDDLLGYITYTKTEENSIIKFDGFPSFDVDVHVSSFGAAYAFNDRLKLKAQYGYVIVHVPDHPSKFHYYSTGVSVFF